MGTAGSNTSRVASRETSSAFKKKREGDKQRVQPALQNLSLGSGERCVT